MSIAARLDAAVVPVEWGEPFDKVANTVADVYRREYARLQTVLDGYSGIGSISAPSLWAPDRVAEEMATDLTPVLGEVATIGLDAISSAIGTPIADSTQRIRRMIGPLSNRTEWVGDDPFAAISKLVTTGHQESWTIPKLSKEIRASLESAGVTIPGDAKWAQRIPRTMPDGSIKYEIRYREGGYWVQRIARTETARVAGVSRFEGARELGLTHKAWDAAGDQRTRQTHIDADGQIRYIDEPFSVGGADLQYPGDAEGPAKEVIFCRCGTRYDVTEAEAKAAGRPTKSEDD